MQVVNPLQHSTVGYDVASYLVRYPALTDGIARRSIGLWIRHPDLNKSRCMKRDLLTNEQSPSAILLGQYGEVAKREALDSQRSSRAVNKCRQDVTMSTGCWPIKPASEFEQTLKTMQPVGSQTSKC